WAARLLPYVEQDNLHRQINFELDILHPMHSQVRVTKLNIFLCPADNAPDTFDVPAASGNVLCQLAFGNYVGMGGTYEVSGYPDTDNGVLIRNRGFRITDIYDGSSNTIMVIERASLRSPMTTWVGAVTSCVNPPLQAGFDEEGPPTLVLTNTGEAADGRTPNNR